MAQVLGMAACAGPQINDPKPAEMKQAQGQTAPDFTATDYRGQAFSLAEASRDSTVVLVFYRGSW